MAHRRVLARRRDVSKFIAEDSATVTVYVPGRTPDDEETSFSFTGRLSPRGSMLSGRERMAQGEEGPIGMNTWVVVAPYDTTVPRNGSRLSISSQEFRVIFTMQYQYKLEILLEERE